MKTSKFKMLLSNTHNLNTFQFRQLQEEVDSIVSTKEVSALLETPIEELHCPHCNSKEFNRWGKRNDLQRYKCKSCKRTFNSLTSTPNGDTAIIKQQATCQHFTLKIRRVKLYIKCNPEEYNI